MGSFFAGVVLHNLAMVKYNVIGWITKELYHFGEWCTRINAKNTAFVS